jgi:glycosyltransferase involved in cell wall biosynthesis
VGFQEDLDLVYGAADVVAVPSKQPDPLPNAALEASAAGCPVVAAAHGGLPEIVRDRQTGRLIAPRDPAALAGVLAELAADPGQGARPAPARRRPGALRPPAGVTRQAAAASAPTTATADSTTQPR